MSALDTLRFAALAADKAAREQRVLEAWETDQRTIALDLNPAWDVADKCLMCGATITVQPQTLIARVSVFEPTRPLCSEVCDARYQALERSPTLVASL